MEASFAASPDDRDCVRAHRPGPCFVSRPVYAASFLFFCATMIGANLRSFAETPAPPQKSGHAVHTPKRADREQIEELEEQVQKAQLSGDVSVMDKLLSEDYLGVNANGELVTKPQQLDHMRTRALVITQLHATDVKIKLLGPTAVVTSEVQLDGTLDGVALRGRYRYTRIYQRVAGGSWKVTSFEATRIRRPND